MVYGVHAAVSQRLQPGARLGFRISRSLSPIYLEDGPLSARRPPTTERNREMQADMDSAYIGNQKNGGTSPRLDQCRSPGTETCSNYIQPVGKGSAIIRPVTIRCWPKDPASQGLRYRHPTPNVGSGAQAQITR